MTLYWPQVANRLVALLPTLPGWSGVPVFDGPTPTDQLLLTWCMVGADDQGNAGRFTRDNDPAQPLTIETGDVRCQLRVGSGRTDLPGARARALALYGAVEDALTADNRLGVLPPYGTTSTAIDVQQRQTPQGALVDLSFTVNYEAIS